MRTDRGLLLLLIFGLLAVNANSQTGPAEQGRLRRHPAKGFERADINHDGQISQDEWKRNPRGFDRLDRNHDGVISRDEAVQTRQEMREKRSARLREMDVNHDGQLSKDEWRGNPNMFDRLDANHDGVVTREELRQRHHRRRRDGFAAPAPPTDR